MQRVNLFFLFLFVLLSSSGLLSAQEAFAPAGLYFQGEVIRKVSVGAGGVWVVKGQDSTGVGKLDWQGTEHDYTVAVNTQVPLTGIVGKWGDSAMIATKGNYLLMFDKGNITRLDEQYGVKGRIIRDMVGNLEYTHIATDSVFLESYGDGYFAYNPLMDTDSVLRISTVHEGISIFATSGEYDFCGAGQVKKGYGVYLNDGETYAGVSFHIDDVHGLNAVGVSNRYPRESITLYAGHTDGLQIRTIVCESEITNFLEGNTVYTIKNYHKSMLIGTGNGLYYIPQGELNPKLVALDLGATYAIYDIAIDELKKVVWLATNLGLIKLDDHAAQLILSLDDTQFSWVKSMGSAGEDKPIAVETDGSGNLYVVGAYSGTANFGDSTLTTQNLWDYYLAKYNPAGELLWVRTATYPAETGVWALNFKAVLAIDKQENVYVLLDHHFGHHLSPTEGPDFGYGVKPPFLSVTHDYVVKYNKEGITQWAHPHRVGDNKQLAVDYYGNVYLASLHYTPDEMAIEKYSTDFDLLWSKSYPTNFNLFRLRPNGSFYLSGSFYDSFSFDNLTLSSPENSSVMVFYFDETGHAQWGNHFGVGTEPQGTGRSILDVAYDQVGNAYVAGVYEDGMSMHNEVHLLENPNAYGFFLGKINPRGKFDWVRFGETEQYSPLVDLHVDSTGAAVLAGNFRNKLSFENQIMQGSTEVQAFLMKLDPAGTLSWYIPLPGNQHDQSANKVLVQGPENTLYLSGQHVRSTIMKGQQLTPEGASDVFMARLSDPSRVWNRNIVRGKTFFDKDKDGRFGTGDEPLADHIIMATPGPVYSMSDSEGNYTLYLQPGEYTIDQIIPNYKGKWAQQITPVQPYPIKFITNSADTAGFDFAHEVKVLPFLSVDVSSTRFRRCFTNTTKVAYCNEGFADAQGVEVVLEYPEHIIPLESSVPWTKNGNTYTFTIGALAAQHCGFISLKDSVVCGDESIRGLSQCIKASIIPKNKAFEPAGWDHSDLELSAECRDNGFVRVHFKNTGTGSMADSAVFNIFLDQQLAYTGKYKLEAEQTMSLNLLANGKPLHLEAQLTPHHPEKRAVSLSMQGCTGTGDGIIEIINLPQFSQNDETEQLELVCMEILDSFDPNDKQAAPAGISQTNNIAEDALIEYTIRFQNTGTDLAYNVIVVDTLSEQLDLSTLKVGVSSHPVKWTVGIDSRPTIIWKFSNILLPDSTSNEPASHGFVKFHIRPKEDLPVGTIIRNSADIFFDYNSPIRTNEVFHTIGIPELQEGVGMLVQDCGTNRQIPTQEDIQVRVCGESYLLSRPAVERGSGKWKVVKGSGILADPYAAETMVSNLSFGSHSFEWGVTYCDQKISSKVELWNDKLPPPPIASEIYVCPGDPLPTLTTIGEDIEWYGDAELTQLLGRGESYKPTTPVDQLLYVLQHHGYCPGEPATITFAFYPQPEPPITQSVEACLELEMPLLHAQGSNIRWYADAQKQQMVVEGEYFRLQATKSQTYYVSQSSEFCESELAEVHVKAKLFDPSKALIANMVSPNGDDKNQYYYLKPFEARECLGAFYSVQIFNRWGKQVFESKQEDFQWNASEFPDGVYFCQFHYQLKKFSTYIHVMR